MKMKMKRTLPLALATTALALLPLRLPAQEAAHDHAAPPAAAGTPAPAAAPAAAATAETAKPAPVAMPPMPPMPRDEKLPPAEGQAKAALEKSPRHGEYVDVKLPAGGTPIRTWVVYPERKDKA